MLTQHVDNMSTGMMRWSSVDSSVFWDNVLVIHQNVFINGGWALNEHFVIVRFTAAIDIVEWNDRLITSHGFFIALSLWKIFSKLNVISFILFKELNKIFLFEIICSKLHFTNTFHPKDNLKFEYYLSSSRLKKFLARFFFYQF